MKLVKAGHEIITEKDPVKKIEKVARTCYKSEKRITEGSAVKMVRALVKHKHYAMLEHASIILESRTDEVPRLCTIFVQNYGELLKLRATSFEYSGRNIVSGNMRAWLEFFEACARNNCRISKDLAEIFQQKKYFPIFDMIDFSKITAGKLTSKYTELDKENLSPREMMVHYDLTVKFICDRGVSHEIVRHREASFAQESTRYCNYGNGVTFVKPFEFPENDWPGDWWNKIAEGTEDAYETMIGGNVTPQMARSVLPISVKTELVMTANMREWRHFFELRALGTTGAPHPQMVEVALPLLNDLFKKDEKLATVLGDLVELGNKKKGENDG